MQALQRAAEPELSKIGSSNGKGPMTTEQLHLFNALYLVVLLVVAVLTRATAQRIAGALAGATAAGVATLGVVALGEEAGVWHFVIDWEPYFLTVLLIDFALCAFVFLITWRIARRFGGRGLAVTAVVGALIGPPRDYWYMDVYRMLSSGSKRGRKR
jgi:hypothetical protein